MWRMITMSDREYAHRGVLADWLQEFADKELKKGGNPFDDIRELFKSKDDLEAVEARVEELCKQVGLDLIEKTAKTKPYSGPIEEQTLKNKNFRKVLFTGEKSQLVLMTLKGGEEIGSEIHKSTDQFFRVEEGEATFVLDGKKKRIKADEAIIVPAGTEHNVINSSDSEPLKLYTIYSPPNHPPGTVEKTKENAEKHEKEAQLVVDLMVFAQALEDEGMPGAAAVVDEQVKTMQAKDKDVTKLPQKYQEYKGLDEFIQNACRTSGGYASVPAIQDRIRKEFDDELDVKNKEFEAYIRTCLKDQKEKVKDDKDDEHAGEYIAIIVTEDNDRNDQVFDEPSSGTR